MKFVDMSLWSTDKEGKYPTPHDWRDMRAEGIGGVVVGLWHGNKANVFAPCALTEAREAGLVTAGYIVIHKWNRDIREHVEAGIEAAGSEWNMLNFCAIDAEMELTHPLTDIKEAMRIVRQAGVRPVVYTANWCWQQYYGGMTGLEDEPLWFAYYDNNPLLTPPGFGGWKKAVGKQWLGSTIYTPVFWRDHAVDYNTFSNDFIWGTQPDTSAPSLAVKVLNLQLEMQHADAALAARVADLERRLEAVGKAASGG